MQEKIAAGEIQKVNDKNKSNKTKGKKLNSPLTKSPSDTTIYAPALRKVQDRNNNKLVNDITNFVENIRIQQRASNREGVSEDTRQLSEVDEVESESSTSDRLSKEELAVKLEEAKEKVNQAILEAEQFKAMINDPRGESRINPTNLIGELAQASDNQHGDHFQPELFNFWLPQQESDQSEVSDDAFFHITCHVNPTLRAKIEKGEYVDLEKLIPKNRFKNRKDEGHFEWVTRGGYTYLAPIEKDSKIVGIRKWEQAFRVYAAIYTKKNPHKAAEIWQYVYIINHAASKFQWENVAEYDFTFRQLMHYNPKRNWGENLFTNVEYVDGGPNK